MITNYFMKSKAARLKEREGMITMFLKGYGIPYIAETFEVAQHTVRVRLKDLLPSYDEVEQFKRDFLQSKLTEKV